MAKNSIPISVAQSWPFPGVATDLVVWGWRPWMERLFTGGAKGVEIFWYFKYSNALKIPKGYTKGLKYVEHSNVESQGKTKLKHWNIQNVSSGTPTTMKLKQRWFRCKKQSHRESCHKKIIAWVESYTITKLNTRFRFENWKPIRWQRFWKVLKRPTPKILSLRYQERSSTLKWLHLLHLMPQLRWNFDGD